MSTSVAARGTNRLLVLESGPLTTVQDSGRVGHAHLGVPRAGFLDVPAAHLANRLVANPESTPLLEVTAGGFAARFDRAVSVAVTGALVPVTVAGRPVHHGQPVVVPAGRVLRLGRSTAGLRAYLAVAGGLAVPTVLGSASHDVLSGLGPAPLCVGDLLALGSPHGPVTAVDVPGRVQGPGEPVVRIGLLPGPQRDWFAPVATWQTAVWTVGQDSNRVGLRLTGPGVPRRAGRSAEMTTEPMVLGAVQVPPSGQPVVFLADHPTTGGYPVVGVVPRADLAVLAQRAPGQQVQFTDQG